MDNPSHEPLSADEARLRRLVEHLPAGAVYIEGRQLFMNHAAETITGYARAELCTIEAWMKKLHPGRADEVRERVDDGSFAHIEPVSHDGIGRGTKRQVALEFVQKAEFEAVHVRSRCVPHGL